MTPGNDQHDEALIFSALLTPHRSLSPRGFALFMAAIAIASFIAGFAFLLMGAWPVFGFFGLDVALIYWAFRVNYARARAYEEVHVSASELRVRKVSHRGALMEWTFNPLWVRLGREDFEEFGIARLYLASHGRELTIAECLGPAEKDDFGKALAAALAAARRGPDLNPLTR